MCVGGYVTLLADGDVTGQSAPSTWHTQTALQGLPTLNRLWGLLFLFRPLRIKKKTIFNGIIMQVDKGNQVGPIGTSSNKSAGISDITNTHAYP